MERIRKNVVLEKLLENIKRFSDICNKKGKHLSLSFTIQRDNWDQLPLVINLCNEVNAYIYVSYLERPIEFALTNLPKDELVKIKTFMEKFRFPILTQKERHNKKCFEDFKNFLTTYIDNNEEKKYYEYRFDNDLLFKEQEKSTSPNTALKEVSLEVWEKWVDDHYYRQETYRNILPKELFYKKIKSVMNDLTEREKGIIRSTMTGTGFDQILDSVKHFSEDELRRLMKQQLNALATTSF